MKILPIAIYLPQFHPIPENDKWWGKGFTEWTNVTKAKPLFKGHYQLHLPSDLGFYDLRLNEARMAQELMARKYGVEAFCYYHYWFNGKRILEEPLNRKLNNPKEDLPFIICWANENWTKVWDGKDKNILLEQKYSQQDFLDHIKSLIRILQDTRYLTVNEKRIIAIYSPQRILEIGVLIKILKEVAKENNLEIEIINFVSFCGFDLEFNKKFSFSFDFEPHSTNSFSFIFHRLQLEQINQLEFNSVGANFRLGKDQKIKNSKYISIGNNFSALDRFRIQAWDEYQGEKFNPEIVIGENVCFNTDIHIGCIKKIIIGDNCLFGSKIYITDHDHGVRSEEDSLLPPAHRRLYSIDPVIIEKNVYVGEGVAILSGVRVGENSIIATNSVVTKDVPSNSVVAEIPARGVKLIYD